jgi:hypothetical protein
MLLVVLLLAMALLVAVGCCWQAATTIKGVPTATATCNTCEGSVTMKCNLCSAKYATRLCAAFAIALASARSLQQKWFEQSRSVVVSNSILLLVC